MVRSSLLACSHHYFAQRPAHGASRLTRGLANSCLIASHGPIIYSTSCLPLSKIRRSASIHSFSAAILVVRTSPSIFSRRHLPWWHVTRAFHVSQHSTGTTGSCEHVALSTQLAIVPVRRSGSATTEAMWERYVKILRRKAHCVQALCPKITNRANDAKELLPLRIGSSYGKHIDLTWGGLDIFAADAI